MESLLVRRLADVAGRRLATIGAEAPLRQAARMLAATPVSLVVVCHPEGRMAGVLSKTDIVRTLGAQPDAAAGLPAAEVMTREVLFCRPDDSIEHVLRVMGARGLVHMPVLGEGEKPVGVMEARDALRALFAHTSAELGHLRDYVMGAGYR